MKGAIDMYRKISPDLVVATNRGGAFSIGAIVLMSYLAFVETWAFVGSGDVREKIDVELGLSPARINIDIEFPKLNCDDATVELWRGKSRAATHGLERTLRVRRFDDATKRSQPYRKIVDGVKADTSDMPGCKLQGFIAYEHTSPGTVAISAPAGSDLSHHVVDFTFGMPLSVAPREWTHGRCRSGTRKRKLPPCNEHVSIAVRGQGLPPLRACGTLRSINCPIVEGSPRSSSYTRTTFLIKKQRARRW